MFCKMIQKIFSQSREVIILTIVDVAKKAGVSCATVSRVINNTAPVNKETRAKIQAEGLFKEWQIREEQKIRQDAVHRSHAVIKGKITEHLVPWFSKFPYNPSDARFLGSPVDFIIFNGLSEGNLNEIVIVEVKTGSSSLSPRERSVARIVEDRKIRFEVIRKE